jgi:hypothetical protein
VSRENLPWLVLAALLLIGGWFASQRVLVVLPAGEESIETFREWLWGTRSMDLAVQVGIVFVGALGIAALLPRGDEMPLGGEILRGDEATRRGGTSRSDELLPTDEAPLDNEASRGKRGVE